jgi:methionine sulfoxide reductase heme-binding subunit
MLGLFAFFYACLHFSIYIVLDLYFDWDAIVKDVAKRPFITAGFTAFVLLIPLALTSTQWAIRKMGGRRWQKLHWLIYVAATAAVIHFWWKVKADTREPLIYATIFGLLLAARVVVWARKRSARARVPAARTISPSASE